MEEDATSVFGLDLVTVMNVKDSVRTAATARNKSILVFIRFDFLDVID